MRKKKLNLTWNSYENTLLKRFQNNGKKEKQEKIDRVESSMTVLKTDVRDLRSEITQVKGSADSVLENCKSDLNVKIQGVNNTITDIKSSVAENRANLEDHRKKVETDIGNVTAIVQQKTSEVSQRIDEIRSDTCQRSTESVINFINCQQQVSACGEEIALFSFGSIVKDRFVYREGKCTFCKIFNFWSLLVWQCTSRSTNPQSRFVIIRVWGGIWTRIPN